ncbi:MAG: SCO family protein [Anaerolineae bacterium]|nr:SCO family protein [Anaerolineae bacterium]
MAITLLSPFIISACSSLPASQAIVEGYGGTPLDEPAPDFELSDQSGQAIRLSDYRGKIVVLAFFDSQCDDVCPLTAHELRRTYQALQARVDTVVFIAVNVNTEASSLEAVESTTQRWQLDDIPNWHFLTGAPEVLEPVWQAYHIEVLPSPDDIAHTPGVYIIDPQGRIRWYVSTPFVEAGTPAPSRPLHELLVIRIQELLAA